MASKTVQIAGEEIEIRQFLFRDSCRTFPLVRPIVESLIDAVEGETISSEAILDVMAANADAWIELVSIGTGRPVEWLDALPHDEALALSLDFWNVNQSLFLTRMKMTLAIRLAAAQQTPAARADTSSANAAGA